MRTFIAATATLVVLALAPSSALAVSSWCSESGDQCYRTKKVDGKRYVGTAFAAKYVDKFELCVKAPTGEKDCVTRKLKRDKHGIWGVNLRWSTTFPNRGKGTYELVSPAKPPITFKVG